jgi:hypothetical protein
MAISTEHRVNPRLRMSMLLAFALALTMLSVYVGSYLYLSRSGYAKADEYGLGGFYYFSPENSDAWRRKQALCRFVFQPLNWIDQTIGTGRGPASEPLWGLR